MKLSAHLLLFAAVLPIYAAPVFNVNFTETSAFADSVAYTGDQTNWLSVSCSTSASDGGYGYCQGDLVGDLLPGPTRASVTSPNMPYNSNGYKVDILNGQSQIEAILQINPSDGCIDAGGGTVTCGVAMILVTSLNGGALSNTLINDFSSIPVAGSFTANGANQTALVLDWSNGRVDNLNVQIAGAQSTPEPATLGLVAAALLPVWMLRRRRVSAGLQ